VRGAALPSRDLANHPDIPMTRNTLTVLPWLFALLLALCAGTARAVEPATLKTLAEGDSDAKIEAINQLMLQGDASALPVLEAMNSNTLGLTPEGRVVIQNDSGTLDAATLATLSPPPDSFDSITINNRVRRALDSALSALRLFSPVRATRLASAVELQNRVHEDLLPLLATALAKESDAEILFALRQAEAGILLRAASPAIRLQAATTLGESARAGTQAMLSARLEKDAAGAYIEGDAGVRAAVQQSIGQIQDRLAVGEYLGRVFSGVSLGSILILVALGLAITYGLMGVINMAHGELLMIGAYATYVTQTLFQRFAPGLIDGYLLAAVPMAFISAALVGMALERSVIRHLYGRPLETLLATWGISLILIQTVRALFGAQNVEVANPSWMSGGLTVLNNLVLPYNRIAIIAFALLVLLLVWLMLARTRLGLYIRATTQNRAMAGCMGVPTGRVDMWAFGLGSGIAGLGGCALSQIGNVGPELGQGYIIDSFLVVVLGGVGQLAGAVVAGLGLGVVNKFLEPYAGAVLAKIMILVFIIIFIQKRPQGLFAMKGRSAEG
jgi:urea transport system permease protein